MINFDSSVRMFPYPQRRSRMLCHDQRRTHSRRRCEELMVVVRAAKSPPTVTCVRSLLLGVLR